MADRDQTAERNVGFYAGPERRQSGDRRRNSGARYTGPERRVNPDRRSGSRRNAARRANPERDRRLTPAGRHALALVASTQDDPIRLTGEEGLLTSLVQGILETGLEIELGSHLGHDRWESSARGAENVRNGAYNKRVSTDIGVIQVQMPRDRRGTFEPVIVPKHGRRLGAVGAHLAALYASGLTRAEIRNQLDNVTDSRLDRETLEAFTDKLGPGIRAWHRRRFDSNYPLMLIDTFAVTIRGSRVTRRAFDVAVGVDAYGGQELLGIWRRPARLAGAEQWLPMLDELHYRGVSAVEFIASGGDEGLASAAQIHWPQAKVRPGVANLALNSLRPED